MNMISEKWSKLSSRERAGIIVAVCVLVMVLLQWIIVIPLRTWFGEKKRHIESESRKVVYNERVLAPANRKAVVEVYQQYEGQMKKKGTTAEENAAMFGVIEGLAREYGVTLVASKPQDPQIFDIEERYSVEIEIEADISRLMRFLYEVESTPQLLRIDKLTVNPQNRADTALLKGNVLISKHVIL